METATRNLPETPRTPEAQGNIKATREDWIRAALDTLVDDLRDQALGNQLAQPGPALSRAALDRARAAFLKTADEDGRVVERFEILTLTGWA